MPAVTDRASLWVEHELRVRAFEQAAKILARVGAPVVPVKGMALSRWLYADVLDRPMTDVDLFVPKAHWAAARQAFIAAHRPLYDTHELRELSVSIGGVLVELHGEVGRRELTQLTVDGMVARAAVDTSTFPFPALRLDDVDHLLLMACNAIKDGFVFAQRHVPEDLQRLLERTLDRRDVLLARARAAGLHTGLYCVAEWMVDLRGSPEWRLILDALDPPPRPWHAWLVRRFRSSRRPTWSAAVVLGCLTTDVAFDRWRAVERVLRRNAVKLVGVTPG